MTDLERTRALADFNFARSIVLKTLAMRQTGYPYRPTDAELDADVKVYNEALERKRQLERLSV